MQGPYFLQWITNLVNQILHFLLPFSLEWSLKPVFSLQIEWPTVAWSELRFWYQFVLQFFMPSPLANGLRFKRWHFVVFLVWNTDFLKFQNFNQMSGHYWACVSPTILRRLFTPFLWNWVAY